VTPAGHRPEGVAGPVHRPPAPVLDGLVPIPTYRDRPATPASNLTGVDLTDRAVDVRVLGTDRWTLLVFLSSRCDGCRPLWDALADPTAAGLAVDERVVAVTHGPDHEDIAALRALAPAGSTGAEASPVVVMATDAWSAYRVLGPPFFVLVDGAADRVVTEGVAWGVSQIAGHVRMARQTYAAG
jgi:hypothetical protein